MEKAKLIFEVSLDLFDGQLSEEQIEEANSMLRTHLQWQDYQPEAIVLDEAIKNLLKRATESTPPETIFVTHCSVTVKEQTNDEDKSRFRSGE